MGSLLRSADGESIVAIFVVVACVLSCFPNMLIDLKALVLGLWSKRNEKTVVSRVR